MNNFSRFFRLIKKYGITSKTVSDATGISSGNISDWKSGRSMPAAKKLIQIADYLGCSVDYLLGRTYQPRMVNILDSTIENIISGDKNFISEESIVHPPVMKNKFYFILNRDRGRLKKIYFLAKAYNSSIMSEEEYCALFTYYSDIKAKQFGFTLTPKDYIAFRKVYDIYVDSFVNYKLNEILTK